MFANEELSVKLESSLSEEDSHSTNRKKNKNVKRFNDEQIRFLEYMFESESKPESRMKQQLARRVGLHPRQVAIWFQNRRARLKTKQIEQDYNILKESYDVLVSKFDSLKCKNYSLRHELQTLNSQLEKQHSSKVSESDADEKGCDTKSENGDGKFEEKPRYLIEGSIHKLDEPRNDDNKRNDISQFDGLELTEATLSSSEKWDIFESSNSSPWWEFWS